MSETNGSTPHVTTQDALRGATSQLFRNLLLFGRLLRGLGMEVNPGRMIDVMAALEHVEIGRRSDFYYTLRSLLVNRQDDLPLFDQAFELFWKKEEKGGMELKLSEMVTDRPKPQEEQIVLPPQPEEELLPLEEEDEEGEELQEIIELTRTYSQVEQLVEKDFGQMSPTEIDAVKKLMAQLVWQLGRKKTRRYQPGRGDLLDFRRSLRRNFKYGGELLRWSRREIKIKPRPLVILADVSGSMEQYTRLLLHFLYSLSEGLEQRVEVFTFGTRLTHITRQLRNRSVDRALQEVSQTVSDWSGGTRIGDALREFNLGWSRRVLRGGAIVILISDGWDCGDPQVLGQEIARLQRLSHRLVWLNPLLGSEQYEPLTRGMVASLPHIDDFLPVHNLASLDELAGHLRRLDDKRPLRRTHKLAGAAFIRPR